MEIYHLLNQIHMFQGSTQETEMPQPNKSIIIHWANYKTKECCANLCIVIVKHVTQLKSASMGKVQICRELEGGGFH